MKLIEQRLEFVVVDFVGCVILGRGWLGACSRRTSRVAGWRRLRSAALTQSIEQGIEFCVRNITVSAACVGRCSKALANLLGCLASRLGRCRIICRIIGPAAGLSVGF